jgi:poly-gamma-glutamate synthase PgsB/CapB
MNLIILLLLLLIGLGVWETARHRRHLRRIGVRVHVNGSRGKSSVTRLIAAGLRGGGLRVVAKTTGSEAAVIHTDGQETPVRRRGAANIREQLQVIRDAAREGCDALVIECMAIRPDLQRTCEHHIVQATHGVITNVRPDHLDVMGPTLALAAHTSSTPRTASTASSPPAPGRRAPAAPPRGRTPSGPPTWRASVTWSSPRTWRWPWTCARRWACRGRAPWPPWPGCGPTSGP